MHHLRHFILFLACCGGLAQADQSAEIYLLLEDTDRFQAEALAFEAEREYSRRLPEGDAPLLDLYFSTALDASLRLESLRLSIDQAPVADIRFDGDQLRALGEGGAQSLQRLRLPPGPHQLVAEFTVWHKEQKLLGRRVLDFTQGSRDAWIELLLEDVPGQIYADSATDPNGPARRIELQAQLWETPR